MFLNLVGWWWFVFLLGNFIAPPGGCGTPDLHSIPSIASWSTLVLYGGHWDTEPLNIKYVFWIEIGNSKISVKCRCSRLQGRMRKTNTPLHATSYTPVRYYIHEHTWAIYPNQKRFSRTVFFFVWGYISWNCTSTIKIVATVT